VLDRAPWNRALASYKEQVALYRFDEAADTIRDVKLRGTYFKPAQEVAEQRAQLLFEWKKTLIDDLNRMRFSGTVTDKSGAQYTGIAGASPDSLGMRFRYGIQRVTWEQVPPEQLLALSESFIDPAATDAADRQWRSAVFASETGQTEAARKLVEAAATARPEYKEEIPQLFPVLARELSAPR
jgi:hypothetical protein